MQPASYCYSNVSSPEYVAVARPLFTWQLNTYTIPNAWTKKQEEDEESWGKNHHREKCIFEQCGYVDGEGQVTEQTGAPFPCDPRGTEVIYAVPCLPYKPEMVSTLPTSGAINRFAGFRTRWRRFFYGT